MPDANTTESQTPVESPNILFIADEPDKGLWDYFEKEKLEGIDLIISCGDLPPQYLSFLATYFKGDVLYVHGNHDSCYDKTPPDGCICIDDTVYEYYGLRIAGLGGSMEYNKGNYQFTEEQMKKRVKKLQRRIAKYGGVDILVTHAPAKGLNDSEDLPHHGFDCFHELLDKYHPHIYAHGHVHMNYNYQQPRETEHNGTIIINAYQKLIYNM
ncbi:MAG: metallophosphoesterase [Eubacterium sp.]|nr:metallophosphoesterase [Eubacterium sp.]